MAHQVRHTLERIVELVPSSAKALMGMLAAGIPHKRMPTGSHLAYLRSAFRLAEGKVGEHVQDGVLLAVVDRLLEIDVEIRWEDFAEVEEEEHGSVEEGVFDFDSEAEPAEDRRGFSECLRPVRVSETAEKLDRMMQESLRHIKLREERGQRERVFGTLLQAFTNAILHTHRSKFTQFLLFYVCSRDASHSLLRNFADLLSAKVFDESQPLTTRVASSAYLASFLARANFVPDDAIAYYAERLFAFCDEFLRLFDAQGSPCSRGAFEAAFQALLYILCYRVDSIISRGGEPAHRVRSLPLSRCAPSSLRRFFLL